VLAAAEKQEVSAPAENHMLTAQSSRMLTGYDAALGTEGESAWSYTYPLPYAFMAFNGRTINIQL
jgi:hypothetical protein